MVRAHVKQPVSTPPRLAFSATATLWLINLLALQPEEKKEASQKKKPHSKTGLWACKINDCNKSFAREADLKRHQRTTKGHSQPG